MTKNTMKAELLEQYGQAVKGGDGRTFNEYIATSTVYISPSHYHKRLPSLVLCEHCGQHEDKFRTLCENCKRYRRTYD